MGGLRKKMPFTFWTFVAGGLALSGFPLITAGFWSKDEILSGAFNGGHLAVFITLAVAALLTAFYTARQISMVFLGTPRSKAAEHAGETKPVMTVPLTILAFFAITLGWVGIPQAFPVLGKISPAWFQAFVGSMLPEAALEEGHSLVPLFTSLAVALGGLTLGWLVYRNFKKAEDRDPAEAGLGNVFRLLKNKYFIDEFYQKVFINPALWFAENGVDKFIDQKVIDGALHGIAALGMKLGSLLRFGFDLPVVNGAGDGLASGTRGLGSLLRKFQTGKIQQYMTIAIASVLIVALVIISIVIST